MKKRASVSIILFFDLILLVTTGLVAIFDELIGEKAGFVVKWIHFIAGLLFVFFVGYHITYNWKALKSYLKK
jgi:thiosulfate reductase cytochrome b subunit